MTNALKYTCQGAMSLYKLRKIKVIGSSLLQIQESGSPPMNKKKMFKSLFRGNNAINLQITGSGIGMLLTYKTDKKPCRQNINEQYRECRNYLQTGIPYQKSEIQLPYIQKADVIDPLPVIEGNPEELVKEIKNKPVKTHAAPF